MKGTARLLVSVLAVLLMLGAVADGPLAGRRYANPLTVGEALTGDAGVLWPGRGELVHDLTVRQTTAHLMADWHSPTGRPVSQRDTRLLWAGRVDGTVLAVVTATAGTGSSARPVEYWTVEASGPDPAHLALTGLSREAPLHGRYAQLVRSVRSPCCGPRYLVSREAIRLDQLSGDAAPLSRLPLHDGLSDRSGAPACAVSRIAVTTASGGRTGIIDLGSSGGPEIPALAPELPGGGAALPGTLAGLDTCRATDGPDGLIRAVDSSLAGGLAEIQYLGVVARWPARLDRPGTLAVVTWDSTAGSSTDQIVWRPDGAAPVFAAPGYTHSAGLPLADGPSTAVTWSGSAEQLVSVTGATVLFTGRPEPDQGSWERPVGIVVLRGTPGTEAVLGFRDTGTGEVHQERYRLSG